MLVLSTKSWLAKGTESGGRLGCKQCEGRIWVLLISKYLIHCLILGILQGIRVEREKVALVDKNTFLQTMKKKKQTQPYQKPVSKRNEGQEIFYKQNHSGVQCRLLPERSTVDPHWLSRDLFVLLFPASKCDLPLESC